MRNQKKLTRWKRMAPLISAPSRPLFVTPANTEENNEMYYIERILSERYRRGKLEYLIKWWGYELEQDLTWEPAAAISTISGINDVLAEWEKERQAGGGDDDENGNV